VQGLCLTSAAVVTLAKTLPLDNPTYKFNIYLDNLFTNYSLLIYLRKLGIGAAGTVKRVTKKLQGHFLEELKPSVQKQGKWGTLKGAIMAEKLKKNLDNKPPILDGVMLFCWKDAGVVFFMSTIHSGKGFILRLRRRYRESGGALVSARRPFDFSLDTDLLN
jgi:hypothetical protein